MSLGIVLAILKFIALALLFLLLLVLLLVLVIVLTPIRYHLLGKQEPSLTGEAHVRWLFGAIKIDVSYEYKDGSEPQISVRIFGRDILAKKKRKKKRGKGKQKRNAPQPEGVLVARESEAPQSGAKPVSEPEAELSEAQPALLSEAKPKLSEPKAELSEAKPALLSEAKPELSEPQVELSGADGTSPLERVAPLAGKHITSQSVQVRRVKLSQVQERPPQQEAKRSDTWEDEAFFTGDETETEPEESTIAQAKKILKRIQAVENKKEIVQAFKKLLKRIIKGILPGDCRIKGTVGTGDPTTTGYIMGLAGMLVAKFGDHVQVRGDFTKATVEDVEIAIKGKLVLGRFAGAGLAFILTKPIRHELWSVWRGRSKKNG